ncbi:MAG: FmdB family zinc ribbon protein [Gemmatimonadota bacterium]
MPVYEYHCKACDALFTRSESMADHSRESRARPACPKCGSRSVEPVFSGFFAKTVRKS